jgi:hypothetical protein
MSPPRSFGKEQIIMAETPNWKEGKKELEGMEGISYVCVTFLIIPKSGCFLFYRLLLSDNDFFAFLFVTPVLFRAPPYKFVPQTDLTSPKLSYTPPKNRPVGSLM